MKSPRWVRPAGFFVYFSCYFKAWALEYDMPKKKTSSKKSAKKPTKKAKASKKKAKDMMQTHAKEEKPKATTLDQIWGDTGNTKYGTVDEATYHNKVSGMNTTDLQAHAHTHGMVPIQDRVRLIKLLMSEFRKYVSGFQRPPETNTPIQNVSEESAKTLAEGR